VQPQTSILCTSLISGPVQRQCRKTARMMFAQVVVFCGLWLWAGGWGLPAWAQDSDLEERYSQTQAQREALQKRVEKIQRQIEETMGQRDDAREALRTTEQAISKRAQRLEQLGRELTQSEAQLQKLQQQQQEQQTLKEQMQKRLAEQLRAQYASGLSPWVALLSAQDPQEIQRKLRYLGYVTQAQAQEVEALNAVLAQIDSLRKQTRTEQERIEDLRAETKTEQAALEKDFAAHEKLVAELETQLADQRGQAEQYEADAQRLSGLIDQLEVELLAQREAERQAAQAAQAEKKDDAEIQALAQAEQEAEAAARRRAQAEAEAARQAAAVEAARRRLAEDLTPGEGLLESQNLSMQELEAKLEGAKKQLAAQEQAAQEAQQEAQRQARLEAEQQARLKAEQERQAARAAQTPEAQDEQGGAAAGAEAIQLTGLQRGAPRPAQGQVQGRFGMERPEGGLWRGVVIRAPEGSPVQAVAAGEVVYADWLSGFGNLLILDHGEGFLTVYGYNQSLLKQVGEKVRAGDSVALVGATGGQVEAGLYFEIRQQGQPVNPQQWISGL